MLRMDLMQLPVFLPDSPSVQGRAGKTESCISAPERDRDRGQLPLPYAAGGLYEMPFSMTEILSEEKPVHSVRKNMRLLITDRPDTLHRRS